MNKHFKKPTTDKEREALARQYTPLVYKIVNQNIDKTPLSYDDLVGFGFEGLTDAMNTYKENRGSTFMQYAAYRIFYFIRNGANKQGHIVSFSDYQQKKAKERGESTFIWKRIEPGADEDDAHCRDYELPPTMPATVGIGKVLEDIKAFVVKRFSKRDADIFFQTFGLGEQDDVPRVKIAKQYNVSSAAITYTNQRIIKAIKEDEVLSEELEDILYGE